MHIMFTRLHVFEYKFNNIEDVDTIFENSTYGVIRSLSGWAGSQK